MPSWLPLTKQQRTDLVAYVKTFSSSFREEKPPSPLSMPSESAANQQSIQSGNELYQKMNCWSAMAKRGVGMVHPRKRWWIMEAIRYPPYDFS